MCRCLSISKGRVRSVGSPHRSRVTVRPCRGWAWVKEIREAPPQVFGSPPDPLSESDHPPCVSPSQPRHSSPSPLSPVIPQPSPLLLLFTFFLSECLVWSWAETCSDLCRQPLCPGGKYHPHPKQTATPQTPQTFSCGHHGHNSECFLLPKGPQCPKCSA